MVCYDLKDPNLIRNVAACEDLKKHGWSDEEIQKKYDEQLNIDEEKGEQKYEKFNKRKY